MIIKDFVFKIGGVEVRIEEAEIDLGNFERDEQYKALIELLETAPDPIIAECIDKAGTDELCRLITPWVLENNEEVVEKSRLDEANERVAELETRNE